VLREEELAVDEDVELAWGAHDQRAVEAGLVLDGRRETRSARFVVSSVAVLDLDGARHGRDRGAAAAGRQGPWSASPELRDARVTVVATLPARGGPLNELRLLFDRTGDTEAGKPQPE
jgi:hypothetical protein